MLITPRVDDPYIRDLLAEAERLLGPAAADAEAKAKMAAARAKFHRRSDDYTHEPRVLADYQRLLDRIAALDERVGRFTCRRCAVSFDESDGVCDTCADMAVSE